jgi:hypothetical protein
MAKQKSIPGPDRRSPQKKSLAQLIKQRIQATYTKLAAGSESDEPGRP